MKRALLSILFLVCLTANADNRYWIAATAGNWNDTSNWSATSGGAGGASVPGASDYVIFDGNGSGNCTVDIAVGIDRFAINGFTGTIDLNGNDITIAAAAANMTFATGTLNDTSGTAKLDMTSSAYIYFSGTTFGAVVDVTSERLYLNGSTFNSSLDVLATNSTNSSTGTGGNTFNGPVTIQNINGGNFYLGNTNPDIFNDDVTFISNGGRILASHVAAGNQYNGSIIIESPGSNDVRIGAGGGTSELADGQTISVGPGGFTTGAFEIYNFTQLGTTPQTLTLGGTSSIRLNSGNTWNGNITVSSPRLFLNGGTYNGTSSFAKSANASHDGSSGGNVFNGITTITNSGTGDISLATTSPDTFNNDVTFNSVSKEINIAHVAAGTQFNGNIYVESTSTGVFFGENGGTAILADGYTISEGPGGFSTGALKLDNFTQLGNTAQDLSLSGQYSIVALNPGSTWNAEITVVAGRINLNGSTFNGNASFTKTSDAFDASNGGNTFNANVTFQTAPSTNFWAIGTVNPDTFNGEVTFYSQGGRFEVARDANAFFNDNVYVESTGDGIGVYFGTNGGNTTLADGKTISVGSNGFSAGHLRLENFVQLGTTAQNITTTGSSRIYFNSGSIWNGSMIVTTPYIQFNGTTFNNDTDFTKNGTSHNESAGGNVFNGSTTITLQTTGVINMGNTLPDIFNGDVSFINQSANIIRPIRISNFAEGTEFHGDVTLDASLNIITFGDNGGSVVFKGNNTQNFNATGGIIPDLNDVEVDKTGGNLVLNTSVNVSTSLTLTNGNLISTASNLLTLEDDATTTGASNDSYVAGPVQKTGDDVFTFPIGDNGIYQPITIDAPANVTDAFTAQYFHSNSGTSYSHTSKDASINNLSDVEYWILDRTAGSSNVNVTQHWNSYSGVKGSLANLVVARWDGSQWKDHGNGGTTGDNNNGTVVTSAAVTDFSPFTLASTDPLTYFDPPPLSIDEKVFTYLNVYPNPVSNTLFINVKDLTHEEVNIYNILGQEVTNMLKINKLSIDLLSIDITNIPVGNYILKTSKGVKKFIKQ